MIPKNKPYLIGETAFHHEGDFDFLIELINHGFDAGVDAMKFHLLFDLDEYMVKSHDAYSILKQWILSERQWKEVIDYNKEKKLDTILLCNDTTAIDFAIRNNELVKAIELHATGLNDYFLLQKAAKFNGSVILGIGGSTVDEIFYAIDILNQQGQKDIFLMYGFQNYPTKYEEINLNKMSRLRDLFNLPIGYADHTDPINEFNEHVSILSIPMGINVCEKHFTHRFGEKRIDSQSAVSLEQLKRIRELMNIAWVSMGNGSLRMSDSELSYGNVGPMKKAIVASKHIKKGEKLEFSNIGFKRTNDSSYMMQNFFPKLIGLKVKRDIQVDEFIDISCVEFEFKKVSSNQFKANNQ
jgi:N,N'-diacetyllegionaminate synthase